MYSYSKNIFHNNNQVSFIKNSQHIAKHLYEYSLHPKVTKGELIIVQISNINYNDTLIDLIGIFKSENKDSFLKIIKNEKDIKLQDETGINISKIETGDKRQIICNSIKGILTPLASSQYPTEA